MIINSESVGEKALQRVLAQQNLTNNDVTRYTSDAVAEKLCRDNPKPLTLEDLREREGKPVWVDGKTNFGTCFAGWKVLRKNNLSLNVIRFTDGTDWVVDSYGKTWLAYDYPPREAAP